MGKKEKRSTVKFKTKQLGTAIKKRKENRFMKAKAAQQKETAKRAALKAAADSASHARRRASTRSATCTPSS